jgi:hypothetical protein
MTRPAYNPTCAPIRCRADGSTRWTKVPPEIDELAADLRAVGWSLAEIAAELDRRAEEAPGAPYSTGWHSSAVRRAIFGCPGWSRNV